MKPLRITLLAPLFPPLPTGAGLQAERMLARLPGSAAIRVLTLGGPGLPERETRAGLEVVRVGSITDPRRPRSFARLALPWLERDPRPQVVLVLGVGPVTYGALLWSRFRKIPVAVKLTLEGEDDPATLRGRRLGRLRVRLLRQAEAVLCPSERLQDLCHQHGLDPTRVHLVPNGVDLEQFRPGGARTPGEIVYLGSLQERKGVHLVVEALASLLDEFPGVKLRLVGGMGRAVSSPGDEAYALRLRERSQLPPLAGHVAFEERMERPEALLGAASIFVLPSEAEGLPNAMLEAMAAGAVPVTRDLPALREVIESGVNGVLVRETTPRAWAEALGSLLRDPERLAAMGHHARSTMEERFDLSDTASSWWNVLEKLAKGA